MKKIIFVNLLLLLVATAPAQVMLEHTYNYSAAPVKFETLGYKYFLMDVPNAQCRIYNSDHSLFRTITCSVPANSYLADIKYLSERVFDNDAGIELVYTWYRYVPTTDSYYYVYGSRIINEDGSLLLNIDGARFVYLNETGENIWKLFAYCYDYSVWPEKVWTNIYSLPGAPVSAIVPEAEKNEFGLKAFPNPAAGRLKVAYSLPPDVKEGQLFLVDSQGRLINRFLVDNHTDHLLLDVSTYPGGTYYYYLEFRNTRSSSQKLVVR